MSLKARLASWLGIPDLEQQVAAFDNRVTEPDKRLGAEVATLRDDTLAALALCHDILGKLEILETGQAERLAVAEAAKAQVVVVMDLARSLTDELVTAKAQADSARAAAQRADGAVMAMYKAIGAAEKRQQQKPESGWDDDLESLDSMRQR